MGSSIRGSSMATPVTKANAEAECPDGNEKLPGMLIGSGRSLRRVGGRSRLVVLDHLPRIGRLDRRARGQQFRDGDESIAASLQVRDDEAQRGRGTRSVGAIL